MQKEYQGLYQQLSLSLDRVQNLLNHIYSPVERLFCAVLIDDIEALMGECESFLIDGVPSSVEEDAFAMRVETVTEEIGDMLKLHDSGSFPVHSNR